MVARENWELLEDAKCYFRILLRGFLFPPPSPPAFSLPQLLMEARTSLYANARGMHFTGILQGIGQSQISSRPTLSRLPLGLKGGWERADKKGAIHIVQGISSSHPGLDGASHAASW